MMVSSKISTTITSPERGESLYKRIKADLALGVVDVDFSGVLTMTTYCAKQVFGSLYRELGSSKFYSSARFANVSEDLKIIIQAGIESALQDADRTDA